MKLKQVFLILLSCAVLSNSCVMYAGATESRKIDSAISIQRTTGAFRMDISPSKLLSGTTSFSLEAGETITINAFYSPASASIDFGYLDPDGRFHFVNVTGGGVNYTFEVEERGSYTLAIRNNSSQTVSVSGTINY